MIDEIKDSLHLDKIKKENANLLIIIFYTSSSEKSKKALDIFKIIKDENPKAPFFSVNASEVKDIHSDFGISTVPAVLVLKQGKVSNIIYGIHDKQYYEMLLYDTHVSLSAETDKNIRHNVIVYTSPTCPWCNAVKNYLKKNRIYFREIDISRDERAARDLVQRTGQMGVPQIDIDGRVVVGFDKSKLDTFLGIKG